MRLRRVRLKKSIWTVFPTTEDAEKAMLHVGACGMVFYPPTLLDVISGKMGTMILTYPDELNPGPSEVILTGYQGRMQ